MLETSNRDFKHVLQELYLLKHSLLPGETLVFHDSRVEWNDCLDRFFELSTSEESLLLPPPSFSIIVDDTRLRAHIQYPADRSPEDLPAVAVKGDNITRVEQQWWQNLIQEKMVEVQDSECPIYELISTHLLPLLHSNAARRYNTSVTVGGHEDPREPVEPATTGENAASTRASTIYHALLTSHHLISPTKRRNLQQWSSQLSVSGFAKVGYPGCIYCEGEQEQVEDFVANVKAMQWLALRVRFVEPLPKDLAPQDREKRRWIELEKVGEVVEEMRRLGRESFVVEMGIGSAGQK